MVATRFPRKDNCYISLLDFGEKRMVWIFFLAPTDRIEDGKRNTIVAHDCMIRKFSDTYKKEVTHI